MSLAKIPLCVFMSEIKFDLALKISIFSVSFMLLFTTIMLSLTHRLTRQKTNFSGHYASFSSCSASLMGKILGESAVLIQENEAK